MEQLDLVYNAFSNLEKNYARSKKTRSEYIADKFGGDINVGSFLIINALSSEEFTDPEDIRKFSEVRKIFEQIKEHREHLDMLTSFNFDEDSAVQGILFALDSAEARGTKVSAVAQGALLEQGANHYVVTSAGSAVAPMATVKFFSLFNKAVVAFAQPFCKEQLSVKDIVERRNLGNEFFKVKASKV